jgi:hypothetical protein
MGQDEPMIDKESRMNAVDFDQPIGDWRVRDLLALVEALLDDRVGLTPLPEEIKPELGKGEWRKPERIKPEWRKPEFRKPEARKPEKEILKEFMKPEQGRKPEVEIDPGDLVETIAQRTAEIIKERG